MTIVPNSGIVEFGTFVPPVPGDGQQGQVPKPLLAEAGYVLSTDGWIPAGGGGGSGTVTSVDLTAGTGISVSGGPITTSGSITVTNTAPDQTVTLTQAGTTTITGTYPSFTISSADQFLGTVTSVGGTGTVNGITLTGTVTSSGSLTLGGTLSGVSLTSQVSGTLPTANGGTGATTYTDGQLLIGNTAGGLTTATLTAGTNVTITNGNGTITIDATGGGASDPLTLSASPALLPTAGTLSLGETTIGGAGGVGGIELLKQISGTRWQQNFNPMIGRQRTIGYLFGNGQTAQAAFPGSPPNLTIVGTGTARSYDTNRYFTATPRVGFVSAATAGSLTSVYFNSTNARFCSVGSGGIGGFLYLARFGTSDAATVAGARMFVGLSSINTAPTNVDPGAQINQIGVAQLSTSSNLHIVYGGSAAQTPIDLGAAWPANRLSQDMYELLLFSSKSNNTEVVYRLTNLDTESIIQGTLTNTTPGTTLPASSTPLSFRNWRTNNATALAVGLDLSSLVVHRDL